MRRAAIVLARLGGVGVDPIKRCAVLLVSVFFLAGLAASAQTNPQTSNPAASAAAAQPGATIRLTTHEVLLDLVVRDKRERLVSDLNAEDVVVYEDGVKLTPKSFQLVTGREQTTLDEGAKAAQAATVQAGTATPASRLTTRSSSSCRRRSCSPQWHRGRPGPPCPAQ